MIRKTRRAYAVSSLFRVRVCVDPRIRDPKKLRHKAHNLRQAAKLERGYAQTALNEAAEEKGRSEKIRWNNPELAQELLWDSKVALLWFRARLKRADVYDKIADKLVVKAKEIEKSRRKSQKKISHK